MHALYHERTSLVCWAVSWMLSFQHAQEQGMNSPVLHDIAESSTRLPDVDRVPGAFGPVAIAMAGDQITP
jgi:hypothetical protein